MRQNISPIKSLTLSICSDGIRSAYRKIHLGSFLFVYCPFAKLAVASLFGFPQSASITDPWFDKPDEPNESRVEQVQILRRLALRYVARARLPAPM
ncbi:hypothetical protein CROQUDRAFT_86760 [Cronartium quercuum f. sp. fusiforme G11]|uniref:Uncharacterized protein n=1 Tax=Cronartium quercuum f. sp. fusiforme G11 TaxID=708437 RepID=A0A9P6NST8_9BASI|nr:hypothetical protein CROQUDRAFT_86760 [Cronartium quercuum f. sp. fusiforme G11]